jgi:hypothetical protein
VPEAVHSRAASRAMRFDGRSCCSSILIPSSSMPSSIRVRIWTPGRPRLLRSRLLRPAAPSVRHGGLHLPHGQDADRRHHAKAGPAPRIMFRGSPKGARRLSCGSRTWFHRTAGNRPLASQPVYRPASRSQLAVSRRRRGADPLLWHRPAAGRCCRFSRPATAPDGPN